MELTDSQLSDLDIHVYSLGGPDDPWLAEGRGVFPSTTSARAERYYAKHGKPMRIYSRGHLVIDFIENDLVLGSGAYAGRPFRLMSWQKRMLIEMYEVTEQTVYDIESDSKITKYMRRNRWAYIQLPKKTARHYTMTTWCVGPMGAKPELAESAPGTNSSAAMEPPLQLRECFLKAI